MDPVTKKGCGSRKWGKLCKGRLKFKANTGYSVGMSQTPKYTSCQIITYTQVLVCLYIEVIGTKGVTTPEGK